MRNFSLVLIALFLALGAVLHAVMPGFFFGMKPDMLLTMMFLAILLFPTIKHTFVAGLTGGVLSALTTTFPSGQIPNFIEKPITALLFFALLLLLKKYAGHLATACLLTAIGTIASGLLFLTFAAIFFALPGGATIFALFVAVVLPAAALNTVLMAILFPVAKTLAQRRETFKEAS